LKRLYGESQFGVLAETKGPSFRVLPLETDKQNSTPGGSLLAVMNANREQPIKDFELTGRWRFTSVDRRFFFGIECWASSFAQAALIVWALASPTIALPQGSSPTPPSSHRDQ
jgi:hypothetical protein